MPRSRPWPTSSCRTRTTSSSTPRRACSTPCPTYRRTCCRQFSDWLKAKYGSTESLARPGATPCRRREPAQRERRAAGPTPGSWATIPARPAGRPAAAAPGHGPVPARGAEPLLRQVRQGHPRRRLPGATGRLALAGPAHAARTIITCGPTTWWATSTGTTISAADLSTRCWPSRAAASSPPDCNR